MAGASSSGRRLSRFFCPVAGYRVRSSGHQPHRKTHGLWVSERHLAKPLFPAGRPLAGRAAHQLLLLWALHDGPVNQAYWPVFRCRIQHCRRPGPGFAGHQRLWSAVQPGTAFRGQSEDRSGLWAGSARIININRQPGGRSGICTRSRLGQRWLLGLGWHQGAGGSNCYQP
jgi:hypothetical protein